MRVLRAPDSFEETLEAPEVAGPRRGGRGGAGWGLADTAAPLAEAVEEVVRR